MPGMRGNPVGKEDYRFDLSHAHAIALHFMHCDFGKIHTTTRVTPAMACGLSTTVW